MTISYPRTFQLVMDDLINKLNQINLDVRAAKDKTTNIDNKLKAIVEKADVAKTLADMADSLSRADQGEVELVKKKLEESICRVTDLQGRPRQNIFEGIPVSMEGDQELGVKQRSLLQHY